MSNLVAVIACPTGIAHTILAEEALRLGAFDLIEKPFNTRALAEVVIEAAATRLRALRPPSEATIEELDGTDATSGST